MQICILFFSLMQFLLCLLRLLITISRTLIRPTTSPSNMDVIKYLTVYSTLHCLFAPISDLSGFLAVLATGQLVSVLPVDRKKQLVIYFHSVLRSRCDGPNHIRHKSQRQTIWLHICADTYTMLWSLSTSVCILSLRRQWDKYCILLGWDPPTHGTNGLLFKAFEPMQSEL